MHPLEQLRDDALREIEATRDEKSLEGVRVKYLGKSGSISEWGERMKTLGKEERPVVGKLLNQARNAVTTALDRRGEKVARPEWREARHCRANGWPSIGASQLTSRPAMSTSWTSINWIGKWIRYDE